MDEESQEKDFQVSNSKTKLPKNIVVLVGLAFLVIVLIAIFVLGLKRVGISLPFTSKGTETKNNSQEGSNTASLFDKTKNSQSGNFQGNDDGTRMFKPYEDERYGYTIIWKDPNDESGRTILYENNINNTAVLLVGGRLNGVGEKVDPGHDKPRLVVGTFIGWQTINGSNDLWVLLKNPVENQNIAKVRIVNKKGDGTKLLIEDLSYGPNKPIPDYLAEAEIYGYVNDIISNLKAIKPGDAIAFLLDNTYKEEYTASIMVLRRYGGKIEFESEL